MTGPTPSPPPATDLKSLTALEYDFYRQYGETLANWARLERALCQLFGMLCELKRDDGLGTALFFSGRSFATRTELLGAAVGIAGLDEAAREVLRALLGKAQQFATGQKRIAHGYPTHTVLAGGDRQGWRIKEGDETEKPAIGIEELRCAALHFSMLQRSAEQARWLVAGSHHLKGGPDMSPRRQLALIQRLPADALHRADVKRSRSKPPRGSRVKLQSE